MTKIISYCLYGSAPLYLTGAIRNAELCRSVFPGWTCRFYVSDEIPESMVEELRALGSEVVQRERSDEIDGMFWRFEPAGEAGVDAMIVRDTDSRLNERDFSAVEAWLESGKKFHFIRDHPAQRKPILGGLWGCRGMAVPDITAQIQQWKKKSAKGNDQHFLLRQIYPEAVHDAYIHTEFVYFAGEQVHSITCPRANPWDYLGCPIDPDHENARPDNADALIEDLKKPLKKRKLPWSVQMKVRFAMFR